MDMLRWPRNWPPPRPPDGYQHLDLSLASHPSRLNPAGGAGGDVDAYAHVWGKKGGVAHFGFRLTRAADIDRARHAIESAGGVITETGEFIPGEPYVFFKDPDGYVVEIWYELPTAVDPVPRARPGSRFP